MTTNDVVTPATSQSSIASRLGRIKGIGSVLFVVLLTVGTYAYSHGSESNNLHLIELVVIWTFCGMSQTLPLGIAGIVTFGQAAFSMVAGFIYAYLAVDRGFPVVLAMLGSVAITTAIAAVLGLVILRLRGYVLAIGTLGVFLAVTTLLPTLGWLSGGYQGRLIPPLIADNDTRPWVYVLAATTMTAGFYGLSLTRRGRTVVALRDNEAAAMSLGVPVFTTQLVVFSISAAVAAFGGILFSADLGFLNPYAINFSFLTALFIIAVLGGLRSFWGPIAGGVFYVILQQETTNLGDKAALVYAIVFLAVVVLLPGGFVALVKALSSGATRYLTQRRFTHPTAEAKQGVE